MKVKDLIAELQKYPEDTEILSIDTVKKDFSTIITIRSRKSVKSVKPKKPILAEDGFPMDIWD